MFILHTQGPGKGPAGFLYKTNFLFHTTACRLHHELLPCTLYWLCAEMAPTRNINMLAHGFLHVVWVPAPDGFQHLGHPLNIVSLKFSIFKLTCA